LTRTVKQHFRASAVDTRNCGKRGGTWTFERRLADRFKSQSLFFLVITLISEEKEIGQVCWLTGPRRAGPGFPTEEKGGGVILN